MIALINFVILVAALVVGYLREHAGQSGSALFWIVFGYLVVHAISMGVLLVAR